MMDFALAILQKKKPDATAREALEDLSSSGSECFFVFVLLFFSGHFLPKIFFLGVGMILWGS